MLEIDSSRFIFKTKKIWFSEVPFDIPGYDGIAFFECTRDVDVKGFSKEEFTTIVIDLTQDLETIWEKMHKNSCRRLIDRARKEGVVIRVNQDYETFIDILSEFRKLKGLSENKINVEFMKKNGTLFLSEFKGNILGGIFCLKDDKNFRALISGSRRLEEDVIIHRLIGDANRLIIWEAIKYAKERGIINFDLGGYYTGKEADPQMEGINKFKSSFGGQVMTHYIYQKDYSMIYYCARKILSLTFTFRNFFKNYSNRHQ